jgi:hypothetical protein
MNGRQVLIYNENCIEYRRDGFVIFVSGEISLNGVYDTLINASVINF